MHDVLSLITFFFLGRVNDKVFSLSCRTNFCKLPVCLEFRCLATKKLEEREIEITISYFYCLLICIGLKELSLSKSIFASNRLSETIFIRAKELNLQVMEFSAFFSSKSIQIESTCG